MDVEQKKQEVLESIANQPLNVVYIRVDICNQVQLADLMKEDFIPYLRGAARTVSGGTSGDTTDSLHEVCINLAKQRALLQGAAVSDVIHFKIDDGTAATRADGTATHNNTGNLSFSKLEDASYNSKTTFGYTALHDLNETGGSVTLSSTSNANTTIVNDDGENVKYFTDFSKYFLTRSRANGEIISVDENTTPYISPTAAEPFIPANTINGNTFTGTAADPTANTNVRHEFTLTANTTGSGYVGANNDITENKYVGNTFVTIEMSEVSGTFQSGEIIKDFDENSATIKSYANTSTILLNGFSGKGTFTIGETLTDSSTNASVESTTTVSNTETIVTLTGNTFLTGSNTDISLGFSLSNTVALDTDSISRVDTKVTITSKKHGISPGTRIALTGADDAYNEFNNTFIIQDTTEDTLIFYTANTGTTTPTGDINMITNIVHGVSSNASIAIQRRTTNASANVVFQSSNLSVGFPIGNNVTGQTLGGTGTINTRTIGGTWYQTKTNEVKTFFTNSTSGTWDYDATNNPAGIESTANASLFWNKEFEPVKINQLVASSGTGNSYVTPKIVLDIALATTSDPTGGFDTSITTRGPGIYLAYPLKTWEDQTHDGTVTLEAYQNFANIVVAPEGLEINFDWKPLANSSGVATNSTHLHANGDVVTSAYNPEECTVLDETEFNAHLGPYNAIATANSTGGFPNAQSDDILLSSIPANKSRAIKVGTSGAVYPSANANPFYPAVGGTHKEIANTQNDITGTQPGSLTANDVFAGSYTEYQKGAVEPASADYRYRIWNDIKWIYGTNPHATGATKTNAYNEPRANAFLDAYDGEFDTEMDAVQDESADSGTSGSVVMVVPESDDNIAANADGYSNSPQDAYQCNSSSGGVVQKRSRTVSRSGTVGSYTYTLNAWGSWAEFPCFFNRMQHFISSAKTAVIGGSSGSYTVANMESNFGKLYQLLKNLENADYGKDFEDPLEPSTSGYATGQGDASFKQETEDLKTAMDALITDHNTEHGRTYDHDFSYSSGADNSLTHPNDYRTTYHANVITEVTSYRDVVKRRITEISNRIGYVNSRDVANGGSTSSPAKSVSGTGQGFQGYSFNSGNGYANTIYSHCNFLAGKKVQLLAKVLKAVESVTDIYNQIKSKRAEYYEYNQ